MIMSAINKKLVLILAILLAGFATGSFMLYQSKSLERDIQTAELLYNGFRPDYNMNVPVNYSFTPWEKDAYPSTDQFTSSTEYFINLMTKHIISGANYGLFALSGVPPYWGEDPIKFTSTNNAWCIALDYDPKNIPNAPFMFSRNLDISHLSEAHPSRLRDIEPYGLKGVLVVLANGYAGEAIFIRAEDIEKEFNPLGLTNAVLRP